MSTFAPFPVRAATAANLGLSVVPAFSAWPSPGLETVAQDSTAQLTAILDGVITNDSAGASTFAYWSKQVATGGTGVLTRQSDGSIVAIGGETVPTGVSAWFTQYAAIPYQPRNIGATIAGGALPIVVGQPLPPPVPNYFDIVRVRRLVDSGTQAAWTPPLGGSPLPADPGIAAYNPLTTPDLIIVLESMANTAWYNFVQANPRTLAVLPDAPYPALWQQTQGSAIRLSDGRYLGGLASLAGNAVYAQAVTVDPITGIGTVAAGTYQPTVNTSNITGATVTATTPETTGNAGVDAGGSPAVGGEATTGPGPGLGSSPAGIVSAQVASGGTTNADGTSATTTSPTGVPTWAWVALAAIVAWFVFGKRGG